MDNGKHFIHGGLFLVVIAVIFGWRTTIKFGGNSIPGSAEEAITDLITVMIALVGFVLVTVGRSVRGDAKSRGTCALNDKARGPHDDKDE